MHIHFLSATLLLAGLFCAPAGAATFVITEDGDGIDTTLGDGLCTTTVGHCSLRAALQEASFHPGPHRIEFNIPMGGLPVPVTIQPNSPLPPIDRPIEIDGTTQPGAQPNTLAVGNNAVIQVVLDGAYASAGAHGLYFQPGASGSRVRGLTVMRFGGSGIHVDGLNVPGSLTGVTIAGNFIGTDGDNLLGTLANGGPGISIQGQAQGSTVGGPAPSDRNLIVANGSNAAVFISAAHQSRVLGNYIGTNRAGDSRRGTARGVAISGATGNASNNTLQANVIGALDTGVHITGDTTFTGLHGNRIGEGTGGGAIAGSGFGVFVASGPGASAPQRTSIGGEPSEGNTIAHWGRNGVRVERNDGGAPPLRYHGILSNSIHGNADKGIELIDTTAGGSDATVNGGQPAPTITSATGNAQGTVVHFSFASGAANASQTFQVFSNTGCMSQGRTYLGDLPTGTDGSGNYTGSIQLPAVPSGSHVTMTATHYFGGNSEYETSEFSGCAPVLAGPGGNPGGPSSPAAIPTLGHAALALLSALVAGLGLLRRKRY